MNTFNQITHEQFEICGHVRRLYQNTKIRYVKNPIRFCSCCTKITEIMYYVDISGHKETSFRRYSAKRNWGFVFQQRISVV